MARSRKARAQTVAPTPRLDIVDNARGFAVCMMIAYHVLFDTTYFGLTQFHMLQDAGWIAWRNVIVTSFLLLVGVGFVLAERHSQRGRWRRIGQIAASAALVSAGSYAIFPGSFIYFGVLHFNVLAALIAPLLLRLRKTACWAGLATIAAGYAISTPIFDPRQINWIGFVAHKPITEDYVPLFPWLGVVLLGIALGYAWQTANFRVSLRLQSMQSHSPAWLRWLGRHSLVVYLVHQPILFALFESGRWIFS
jgi:uncharacterized membrane protein